MRAVLVVMLGLVACSTKPNPNRCCTDTADCESAGIPDVTPCGDDLVCRGHQCIAEVCTSASQCDLSAPFCVDMSCSAMCTADDQCPGNGGDSANTHCVAGACVACRADAADCPSSAPVCESGACRACTAASECGSGICDFDTGACVDESAIAYASPGGSSGGACTMSDPCTVDRAFAVLDATRTTIKLLPGTHTGGSHQVTGAKTAAIYGPATLNVAGLDVSDGATLRVVDLDLGTSINATATSTTQPFPVLDVDRVSFALDDGINCMPCTLTMTRAKLHGTGLSGGVNQTGVLIYASTDMPNNPQRAPRLTIDRSSFDGCESSIEAGSTNYTIKNSIFSNTGASGAIGTTANTGLVSSVEFSTFYNSTWACSSGTVTASNNIFVNDRSGAPANTVTGNACVHSYSIMKPQGTAPNGSSLLLDMDPRFVNAGAGDFHLMSTSPAIDAADPSATISTDYDGTERPQGPRRDIGAFEYKP